MDNTDHITSVADVMDEPVKQEDLPPDLPFTLEEFQEDFSLQDYDLFRIEQDNLKDINETTSLLKENAELTPEVIAAVEARFPGLIYDNLTNDEIFESKGVDIIVGSLESMQLKSQFSLSLMSIGLINKLQTYIVRMTSSDMYMTVTGAVSKVKNVVKGLPTDIKAKEEDKLMKYYVQLMGAPADDPAMVYDFLNKIKEYKNPLESLKEFPNSHYDKMFTPFLASTVSERDKLLEGFAKINDTYANLLVRNIEEVQSSLQDILETGHFKNMQLLSRDLIPKGMQVIITDIVATLNVDIDPGKPLVKQSRKIASGLVKGTKPTEHSIRKKATVVNALLNHHKDLDEAFNNVREITKKLAKFDKGIADQLVAIRKDMVAFKKKRTVKSYAKDVVTGQNKASMLSYKKLLADLDDLWSIVRLFVKLNVIYVMTYSITEQTINSFHHRLYQFNKNLHKLTLIKDTSGSSEDEEDSEEDDDDKGEDDDIE